MSAIGGIFNTDGNPIDQELLEKMCDVVSYRGPDGRGVRVRGNVGLAHRLLATTEESLHEKQPLNQGKLWIVADCRIDNREELKSHFPLPKTSWEKLPDASYILLAYERWGEDAPARLLGDFAFAIWDERDGKLFCARDPIGIKPFVYHWNGVNFLFGSEAKQIFQADFVPESLNLGYPASLLLSIFPERDETPFEAIRRLPPGHSLSVQGGKLQLRPYEDWDPDGEPLSRETPHENADRFRWLFEQAVRDRLRAPRSHRIGSLLSGGLDSSSIVSIAAPSRNSSHAQECFPVFTLLFSEADPDLQFPNKDAVDERGYIHAMLEKYCLGLHETEIKGRGPLDDLEALLWHHESPPFFPNLTHFHLLFKNVRHNGVRVLLHGEGGDELFQTSRRIFWDLLKRLDLPDLFREMRGWHQNRRIAYRDLLGSLILFLIPEILKKPYRHFIKRMVPDWLDKGFVKKWRLKERVERSFFESPRYKQSRSQGVLTWMRSRHASLLLETLDQGGAAHQLEIRLPFLDLRLLRFAASLPSNQKVRGGITKWILREALKDRLPDKIRSRPRKAEFSPAIQMGFKKYALTQIREVFKQPHPLLRSMISPSKVRRLVEGHWRARRASLKHVTDMWSLWYLTSVDQWLKHRKSFSPSMGKEVLCGTQEKASLAA